MKKVVVLVVVFCLGFQAFSQRKPKIKGNRNVVEVTQELSPFRAIELSDDLDIMIEKGTGERVTIEADDNLVDVLKFNVENNTLYISSFYNITSSKTLNITIFYSELDALTISNGLITMTDVITSDVLAVQASGTARLVLNASADAITIHMEGNSSGDFNVASDALNCTFKDRIDAKVYATGQNHKLFMYENASVKIEGNTASFTAKVYGSSALNAEEFEAKKVVLSSEDSPDVHIFAVEEFILSAKGSSKTSLYGNPKISITEFLDTSQLHKENK